MRLISIVFLLTLGFGCSEPLDSPTTPPAQNASTFRLKPHHVFIDLHRMRGGGQYILTEDTTNGYIHYQRLPAYSGNLVILPD